jgi:hypothetical protein
MVRSGVGSAGAKALQAESMNEMVRINTVADQSFFGDMEPPGGMMTCRANSLHIVLLNIEMTMVLQYTKF